MNGSSQPATFAEVFASILRARGLSQRKAAILLKVSDSQVSRWQRGIGGISLGSVERIATTFGVDRDTLARLADLLDSDPATVETDTSTAEIDALVDADRAELHEELRGIPQLFWTAILTAQRAARHLAIDNARSALELVSTPPSSELAPPGRRRRRDDRPTSRDGKGPLAVDFSLAGAY